MKLLPDATDYFYTESPTACFIFCKVKNYVAYWRLSPETSTEWSVWFDLVDYNDWMKKHSKCYIPISPEKAEALINICYDPTPCTI